MYTLVHLATNDTIRIFGVHLKASSGEDLYAFEPFNREENCGSNING
jgi:hypothetical protein